MGPVRRRPEEIWREHIEKANLSVGEFLKAISVGPNWARLSSEMETLSMVWGHDLYDDLMAAAAAEGYEPAEFETLSRSYAEDIIRLAPEQFSIPFVNPQNGTMGLFDRKEKITQYLTSALAKPPERYRVQNEAIYHARSDVTQQRETQIVLAPVSEAGAAEGSSSSTSSRRKATYDEQHKEYLIKLDAILLARMAHGESLTSARSEWIKAHPGISQTAFYKYIKGAVICNETRDRIEAAIDVDFSGETAGQSGTERR